MFASSARNDIDPSRVSTASDRASRLIGMLAPLWLAQLALRFGLAVPFFRSGMSKWDGFLQLNDTAIFLFSSEFQLHLPGGPYPYPAPALTAFAAGLAEVALPVLLVFGLATRFAAFGLFVMTIVIQLTVPDGWPIHITWAAMALGIMASGPGKLSLDTLLCAWRKGNRK